MVSALAVGAVLLAAVSLIVATLLLDNQTSDQSDAAEMPSATLPSVNMDPVYAFLGDSYTAGAKAGGLSKSFPRDVCRAKTARCVINGQDGTGFISTGNTLDGVSAYGDRILKLSDRGNGDKPSLIVVQGGLSDPGTAAVRTAASRVFAALKTAYPNARVLVVGPVQPRAFDPAVVTANRIAMRAAAADAGLRFLDPIGERWIQDRAMFDADGKHLTASGYQVFADQIVLAINQVLSTPGASG
ncbi:MAG: SGNH/GDSL hydrolase family protein [Williamsia sp.]|nr:SGNH/GDSL hydrolase family protein [Williamsia sp.]